jgi:mono/diheme cytochrome c family protein
MRLVISPVTRSHCLNIHTDLVLHKIIAMKTKNAYYNRHEAFTKLSVIFIVLVFAGLTTFAQNKGSKWEPPKDAEKLKNPLTPDAVTLKEAKTLYTSYCTPCHGDKGKGDGVAAAGLAIKPADHSSVAVQSKADGSIFWELSEGHNPMPSYKQALTEKQRWELVNYIRTLASKPKH